MTQRIDLELIYGNPDQPRKTFNEDQLRELADSITENGLLQPITVRADGEGRYMIVAGERRWRAHKLAGLPDIACMLSEVDDKQLAIDAIIENDQRVDVVPLEQAKAYRKAMDDFGWTAEQLAKKLGKPVFRIDDRLKFFCLSDEHLALLASGQLNPTEAYYVAMVPKHSQGRMIKAINRGECRTMPQLAALAQAIVEEAAEVPLFEMEAAPAQEMVRAAKSFEDKLTSMSALLRSAIDDNQVTAVRKVNPGRASTIAELLGAMRVDVGRLETAFRVAAGLASTGE